jgi:hypothetical protein
VVTNDRTVYTFAEDFFRSDASRGVENLPDEFGLTGLCLDPHTGYVFVTFSYLAEDGQLRNSIARFETRPEVFALEPTTMQEYPDVFEDFPTDTSHQIGGCQVDGDFLYVGVGDGLNTHTPPLGVDSPLGKVLRFTLDGRPAPGNPFRQDDDPLDPANYVWAYGFRNPYGLKIAEGEVFVAENGGALDRFVRIEAGKDYLWDGNDLSLSSRADVVFAPVIAPTQMDFYSQDKDIFPSDYQNTFFVGASGEVKGIVNIPFDFAQNEVFPPPRYFLRYLGTPVKNYEGIITGLALGLDGLYFAPLLPNKLETAAVFRIFYDADNQHPYRPEDVTNPGLLLSSLGCLSCHSYKKLGSNQAPTLDYDELIPRIQERVNSPEYLQLLDEIDQLNEEPYIAFRGARQSIREQEGDMRLRAWIKNRILEPKFDDPNAQMPNLGVTSEQATIIADFLAQDPSPEEAGNSATGETQGAAQAHGTATDASSSFSSLLERIKTSLPSLRYRYLPFVFLAGAVAGIVFIRWFERRAKP